MQKELIGGGGGGERASEGQEALLPPMLNARRRQKRQHLQEKQGRTGPLEAMVDRPTRDQSRNMRALPPASFSIA